MISSSFRVPQPESGVLDTTRTRRTIRTADASASGGSSGTGAGATGGTGGTGGTGRAGNGGTRGVCRQAAEENGPYSLLTIENNPGVKGAIDPSVVYAAGAPSGWMTYTTVPDEAHDHIAIAVSSDAGATWRYVGNVTAARPITISTTDSSVCGASECAGTFIHESSSLVVDPSDPDRERLLKVFVHSYFFGSQRHLELGFLALYTAPAPEGPWTETKLFGWNSDSPISADGVRYNVRVAPELPELHDCFIVGEPGGLYREPGILELSLSCVVASAAGVTIDVRLLRSRDHGASWTYVSRLLSPEDGAALGSTEPQINGSALLHADGRYYVIVSPTARVDFPDGPAPGYRGCVVVPIADLETGMVERCEGQPVIEAAYRGQPGQFVGACSADVGASNNGMLIPVPDLSGPSGIEYRIFSARAPLP
jgi:hypothetical protein